MAHNILTISTLVVLHNWCQVRRAVPISAPGGGQSGVGLEERPHINPEGVPEDMLAGDRARERGKPRMHGVCRVLELEITAVGMQRPYT